MVLHFAKPVEDKAGQDAFAFWLESHLKTQNDVVLNEIEALSNNAQELESLIRKASELVLSYSEDFELPTSTDDGTTSEEDLYLLLVTEWNNYQNSASGMGKAVFTQNIKPQTILPADGKFFSTAVTTHLFHHDVDHINDLNSYEFASFDSYTLSPLKSGTAIGAP